MVKFELKEYSDFVIVEMELGGAITPDELAQITLPPVPPQKGVILSGRAPIWLYVFLAHHFHPARWIAVYDPRIGAIVVESHHPTKRVGEVVQI